MSSPIFAFTTDFGESDGYVAQLKGVVLSAVPEAVLVDVSHRVPPQDVSRAAGLLEDVVGAFPDGTMHVVVVDPGVGTARPIVAVETVGQRFVAPDNGVLSNLVERFGAERIVECTDPSFWGPDVSHTFHGRDVMAPLAAHWANGADPDDFGVRRERLGTQLESARPDREASSVRGRVLWADHFGNLITNVRAEDVPLDTETCRVLFVDGTQLSLHATYAEVADSKSLALIGSSKRMEIAVNGGSAAQRFGWKPGDDIAVVVEWGPEDE